MPPEIAFKIDQEFSKYPLRTHSKGTVLVHIGETTPYLFYVKEGSVKKYNTSYRGEEKVIHIFKPPVLLPMTPLLTGFPSHFLFKADEVVTLHMVPIEKALDYFKTHADVLFGLLSWSYRVIDGLQGRIFQFMAGNAKSRVLYELIYECRRFAAKSADNSYLLTIGISNLAARCGLSRETVSREISKLKTHGLIESKGQSIFIPNLKELEKKLEV